MSARKRIILSLVALLGVYVIGTAGYVILEDDISIGDAAYMTIITISTVGFGETWKLDPTGKLWTIAIIVFGVGTASMVLSSLFSLVVSGELRAVRGRLRMQAQIDQLSDHVIVCGHGRMGTLITEDILSHGRRVVVIEAEPKKTARLDENKTPYVPADATEDETLKKAGVERAKVLVTTLHSDADNLYVTLSARALNPNLLIIARAEHPGTEAKLIQAGANRVVCPQIIGAHRISNLISRPHVVDFVEVAARGVELEISEYVVGPNSAIKDTTLRESNLRRRSGGMVVAIKRADGRTIFSPDPDESIQESDTLVVIGTSGVAERLAEVNI